MSYEVSADESRATTDHQKTVEVNNGSNSSTYELLATKVVKQLTIEVPPV